ncbi:hypothetical protein [Saccharopolyspora spinosa]|uniref:hypothetical protein n=1 Tax=Saccharopolyspora spinosa TaxID=60894 RepID=UPI0002379568|nr:hypothetical protein [Saccharopolyspora spinosa]
MQKRAGETAEQWRIRLAHSCYLCGSEYADLAVLAPHEDRCDGMSAQRDGHD